MINQSYNYSFILFIHPDFITKLPSPYIGCAVFLANASRQYLQKLQE